MPLDAVAETALPSCFEPATVDGSLVRRRVRRIVGRKTITKEQRALLAELVRINEIDLRLAVAIEDDEVDEETKELVCTTLDGRLRQIQRELPDDLFDVGADCMVPEWLDGSSVSPHSFKPVPVPTCTFAMPGQGRAPRRALRTRTSSRRGDPDPEPEPPLVRSPGGAR